LNPSSNYEAIILYSSQRRVARGLRTENRDCLSGGIALEQHLGIHYHHHDNNKQSIHNSLNNFNPRPSKPYMKKLICLLMGAALLAACEQKETTVTNPPGEKKESNTTIVKESPSSATKTESKTDINVNTSPSPR
jgi:hypothetical protein